MITPSSPPATGSARPPGARPSAAGACAVLLLAAAVAAAPAPAQERARGAEAAAADPVHARLRALLEPLALEPDRVPADGLRAAGVRLPATEALLRFYAERSFRPAWTSSGGVLRAARETAGVLGRAASHGLSPDAYHVETARGLLARPAAGGGRGAVSSPDSLAALELLLTDAYLRYASHLLGGRLDPASVDPDWAGVRREERDPVHLLRSALEEGRPAKALEESAPPEPGYDALRRALERFREAAARGGWPEVPAGPTLRQGDRGTRVAALRRRLAASGELPEEAAAAPPESASFDDAVDRAVRSFQARHGLEADGLVGRETLAALNATAAERARRIEANLERWRWLSRDLGRRHVFVNIADFNAVLVEADSTVLETRTVVGRAYRQTPVFSDTIRYLVLNPSWNVPHSIATLDILPQVQEDRGYLERQGMAVYSGWATGARPVDPAAVDWSSLGRRNFPYRFVQRPGPMNALGRVKFMFPNRFNVYLHDTPARGLFARGTRTFSSGCIRVEKANELAERLLVRPGSDWTAGSLQSALETGRERTVPLPEPVPIHIQYWTAWAEPDGTVQFREDVYGRDRKLIDALDRAASSPGTDR